ncbi:MAG: glutaconate CoA-transferase [Clostridiales Family XIII bacterium]|jgi:glutaconate CoA-transferase subunit A|nr:glutaconate CoA-transferase [Clostridiales Family XIII bacterium]
MSKVVSAQEAISTYLKPGDMIAIGGFVTNRRPYGLVREIIKQRIGNLYIEGGPSGGEIDMLIGAGLVTAINISYIANSGFSQVCRRFRNAIEKEHSLLFEDYSLDVQTIAYHGAALGLSYMPVKNMLGTDLERKWGISEEERKKHPKLPAKKFVIQEDPFDPGSKLCLVPTPKIDVALVHAQVASPDGTCRINGPQFQDMDIAMAAKHTIISADRIVSDDEIRHNPELNTLTGLVVDAVVPMAFGCHPSQCFGVHDMDPRFFIKYEQVSKSGEAFDAFIKEYVDDVADHNEYLDKWGASNLLNLRVQEGVGYVPGLKRK